MSASLSEADLAAAAAQVGDQFVKTISETQSQADTDESRVIIDSAITASLAQTLALHIVQISRGDKLDACNILENASALMWDVATDPKPLRLAKQTS